jgi:hypothetical protein
MSACEISFGTTSAIPTITFRGRPVGRPFTLSTSPICSSHLYPPSQTAIRARASIELSVRHTGVLIRSGFVLSVLVLLFVLFGVAPASTPNKSLITVRGRNLGDGVVVLEAAKKGSALSIFVQ